MSWLSKKTGIHLGNIGAPIGALLGSVIPGVGTAIGAGLGQSLGAIGQKRPIGQALAQGVGAYAAGKAIPAGGGATGVLRALPTFTGSNMPNPVGTPPTSSGGGGNDWLGTLMGGLGTAAGKVGGYIKDNPMDVALAGLATAQGVNSAKAAAQQGKYSDAAINNAKQRWAAQAPLRNQGINGMLNKTTHDYSSVYTDPQNPFAVSMRKAIPQPTAAPAVSTRPVQNPPPRFGAGPTANLIPTKRPLLLKGGPKLLPARAS